MPEHDTEVEYEDWTTEVIPPARAFYATTTSTTGLNDDQSSYDRAMKDPKATWLRNLLAELDPPGILPPPYMSPLFSMLIIILLYIVIIVRYIGFRPPTSAPASGSVGVRPHPGT